MTVAFNIVLNTEKPPFDPKIDTRHILKESDQVAKILEELELQDFDEFISANPEEARAMLAELGGDDGSDAPTLNDIDLPQEQWFLPEEGLSVVRKLTAYLEENPEVVRDAKGILGDLKSMHSVLTKAAIHGLRWHLVDDF